MLPELPADAPGWAPESALLETQGLAVLRSQEGKRYASLECGHLGGGHGHLDRLHLTLHADGVHWLPDFGTGSYVSRDLFWYRSTLAHNAPRLDGVSQPPGDATCEMFDVQGEWAWARGRYGDVTRTVVSGAAYALDVVELSSREEHLLELPWHFQGRADARSGVWEPAELGGEGKDRFVSRVERLVPDRGGPVFVDVSAAGRSLNALVLFEGELLRAEGPGRPGTGSRDTFYVVRARGRSVRVITVLDSVEGGVVRGLRVRGGVIEVETASGVTLHTADAGGWQVTSGSTRVRLAGARAPVPPFQPLLELDRPTPALGAALRVGDSPPLDGTPDGFDQSEPLRLELEDQYRRSEEPYGGPDDLSAVAYAAWDDAALYLAVDVTKLELCFRTPDAPPLGLDNEPDNIHSDGLQLYSRDTETGAMEGFLVVPEGQDRGGLRVHGAGDFPGSPEAIRGAWRRTPQGYCVTLALAWPEWQRPHVGGQIGFDLIVNEMLPGRLRRAGQLVWSGGDGWVYLRGDRQDPERMGVLELVG